MLNIKNIISIVSEYCIYFYKRYHYIFYHENIVIPINIKDNIARHIYEYYVSMSNTEYVYDICLMEQPFDRIIVLDRDTISLEEMLDTIDDYIEKTRSSITLTSDINIVSLSKHPIENYVRINYDWIKQIIDLYLY